MARFLGVSCETPVDELEEMAPYICPRAPYRRQENQQLLTVTSVALDKQLP